MAVSTVVAVFAVTTVAAVVRRAVVVSRCRSQADLLSSMAASTTARPTPWPTNVRGKGSWLSG